MRFACDVMLGKLAKYLRILGFDAAYAPNQAALDRLRVEDPGRTLLTRRRRPSGFRMTVHIESEIAREQLREIKGLIKPQLSSDTVFTRCIECNAELIDVERTDVEPRVPEFVYHNYRRFKTCPSCGKIYWQGSHTMGMEALVKEMLA
jgi:uncharacterized protein with PIN domain